MSEFVMVRRELLEVIANSSERTIAEINDAIQQARSVLAQEASHVEGPLGMVEPVAIDLDVVDWETIQKAADESNWMPNEYMRNEWVADVCNFLKYGRADTSPPAPVAVVLPERLTPAEIEELEVIEVLLHSQGLSNLAGTMAAARQFIDEVTGLDKVKELNQ